MNFSVSRIKLPNGKAAGCILKNVKMYDRIDYGNKKIDEMYDLKRLDYVMYFGVESNM